MKALTLYDRGSTLLIIGGVLMLCLIVGGYFLMSDRAGQNSVRGIELESFGTVPEDPVFTERSGREMRLGELRGAPWVASFIFTRCQGICPIMTESLGVLQDDLDPESRVKLVSFTVDPEYDTPERLAEYATEHNADSDRWLFLRTGDSVVQNLARDAFHVAIAEGTDPMEPIIHSSKFFVVDAEGEVRGIFDGRSQEGRRRLLSLLKSLY
ncbi:MAG: SCO family protein [Chlorobi bacterium]|nr:SCO family protein [Chlorobiota bacterium]